ncbi:MAG: aldehyde dehydrogenase family protein, partial [Sphingobacteriales bacterium]
MQDVLKALGIKASNGGASTGTQWIGGGSRDISSFSPVDGKEIAKVTLADEAAYEQVIKKAQEAFIDWRMMPSPKRGDIVRQVGEALRKYKEP